MVSGRLGRGADADGAVFVGGLAGVRVVVGEGELVGFGVVHGDEDLAGGDGLGEVRAGDDFAALGLDLDLAVGADAFSLRIAWVDLDVDFFGVELPEDGGLAGAGLGVPLRGGAATGVE